MISFKKLNFQLKFYTILFIIFAALYFTLLIKDSFLCDTTYAECNIALFRNSSVLG